MDVEYILLFWSEIQDLNLNLTNFSDFEFKFFSWISDPNKKLWATFNIHISKTGRIIHTLFKKVFGRSFTTKKIALREKFYKRICTISLISISISFLLSFRCNDSSHPSFPCCLHFSHSWCSCPTFILPFSSIQS